MQLTDKAAAMAGRASDAAHGTVNRVTDKVAAMTDRAAEVARETVTQISHKAAVVTDKASSALHDAIPDAGSSRQTAPGMVALAVAAAVGIAYQRRNQEERQFEPVD